LILLRVKLKTFTILIFKIKYTHIPKNKTRPLFFTKGGFKKGEREIGYTNGTA
jgi:hypothetical protein